MHLPLFNLKLCLPLSLILLFISLLRIWCFNMPVPFKFSILIFSAYKIEYTFFIFSNIIFISLLLSIQATYFVSLYPFIASLSSIIYILSFLFHWEKIKLRYLKPFFPPSSEKRINTYFSFF